MDFILRIFFSGMIAFVPSDDGKELTVVLVNTHAAHVLSDGTPMGDHQPLLLARAKTCVGDCDRRNASIAEFLYAEISSDRAADALEMALDGGGAWRLRNAELSVAKPATSEGCLHPPLMLRRNVRAVDSNGPTAVPSNAVEREDFSWIADLSQVAPSIGSLNPAVLGTPPPEGLVVARLKLRSGKVFTYSLVRIGGKVRPVHFRPVGSTGDAPYAQAVANWVAAEIRVPGDSVELIEQSYADGSIRKMRLTPDHGEVEVAVLNIPPFEVMPVGEIPPMPQPGKHFEAYFSLLQTPPDVRPVPYAKVSGTDEPSVDWRMLDPDNALRSELLSRLRMEAGRGVYDRVLCPMVQY
jgi:hypothetical protein